MKKAGVFPIPEGKFFPPSWGSSEATHRRTGNGMEVSTPAGELRSQLRPLHLWRSAALLKTQDRVQKDMPLAQYVKTLQQ